VNRDLRRIAQTVTTSSRVLRQCCATPLLRNSGQQMAVVDCGVCTMWLKAARRGCRIRAHIHVTSEL
jgi:hypothetical protein